MSLLENPLRELYCALQFGNVEEARFILDHYSEQLYFQLIAKRYTRPFYLKKRKAAEMLKVKP